MDSHYVFIDKSVDTGDIPEEWDDQKIRETVRDEYLQDSTVTILLVGAETKYRKHVDWESYSSMFDGKINKKSGILVIVLPSADHGLISISSDQEKYFYPEVTEWRLFDHFEYKRRCPSMPERIIDNLANKKTYISVTSWDKIASNPKLLRFLINQAHELRVRCDYDLSRPMRRKNSISGFGRHPGGLRGLFSEIELLKSQQYAARLFLNSSLGTSRNSMSIKELRARGNARRLRSHNPQRTLSDMLGYSKWRRSIGGLR